LPPIKLVDESLVCVCSVTGRTMCTLYASHYLSTDSKCAFVFVAAGWFHFTRNQGRSTNLYIPISTILHAYDRLTRDTHTSNSEMPYTVSVVALTHQRVFVQIQTIEAHTV
jgi:hypothetical protein